MKKRFVTRIVSSLLLLCVLGVGAGIVVSANKHQAGNVFAKTNNALSKSIETLQHQPNVTQTGFASVPPNKFNITFAVRNVPVTQNQVTSTIETYLNNARSYDSESNQSQFLKPYELQVEVHKYGLGGSLLFTGVKAPGSNTITWKKAS